MPASIFDDPPLHAAADIGHVDAVRDLVAAGADVDALHAGHTALWRAVFEGHNECARALVAAGADPWHPMMAGWSPGRLSLAGPDPELFGSGPGNVRLTNEERQTIAETRGLAEAFPGFYEGASLMCVAGIDGAEAVRRIGAAPAEDAEVDAFVADWWSHPWDGTGAADRLVGVTDVPGGCVISQPWSWHASESWLGDTLSAGTTCYGLFVNPKSGSQGSIHRDGTGDGWDLVPGGETPTGEDSAAEILRCYLLRGDSVTYAFDFAGLHPADDRAVTGSADSYWWFPT